MVGPCGRLEELPRAVAQRGVRAVFRGALRREGSRRRACCRTCSARCGAPRSTQSRRARSTSATGSATSRADERVFRAIVYNKAAMVLHMLRRLVGDEAFFGGVRDVLPTTGGSRRRAPTTSARRWRRQPAATCSRFFETLDLRIEHSAHEIQLSHVAGRGHRPFRAAWRPGRRPDHRHDRPTQSGATENVVVALADKLTERADSAEGARPLDRPPTPTAARWCEIERMSQRRYTGSLIRLTVRDPPIALHHRSPIPNPGSLIPESVLKCMIGRLWKPSR